MRTAPTTRRFRIIVICLGILAAFCWGAAFSAMFRHPRAGETGLEDAGAATFTIVGAVLWTGHVLRDRDKKLLLKCIAEHASQRGGEPPTGPLRRVA